MRYVRKFIKGDDITSNDYVEPLLDVIYPIPNPDEVYKSIKALDSVPIRAKTRYRSKLPGRRAISAPTFDLVTSFNDLDYFKEPPKISHHDINFKISTSSFKALPSLSKTNISSISKHKSLPPLPEQSEPKITSKQSYIRKKPPIQTSMPVQKQELPSQPVPVPVPVPVSKKTHTYKDSLDTSYTSCINIIQSYFDYSQSSPLTFHTELDYIQSNHSTLSISPSIGSSIYSKESKESSFSEPFELVSSKDEIIFHKNPKVVYRSMVDDVLGFDPKPKNETIYNKDKFISVS